MSARVLSGRLGMQYDERPIAWQPWNQTIASYSWDPTTVNAALTRPTSHAEGPVSGDDVDQRAERVPSRSTPHAVQALTQQAVPTRPTPTEAPS